MSLQNIIETAFENRADITPATVTPEVKEAVLETIRQLDSGKLRVAERLGVGEWKVNEWAKKAVLLSFRIQDNEVLNDGVNKPPCQAKSSKCAKKCSPPIRRLTATSNTRAAAWSTSNLSSNTSSLPMPANIRNSSTTTATSPS